jgi:hypothetical protein
MRPCKKMTMSKKWGQKDKLCLDAHEPVAVVSGRRVTVSLAVITSHQARASIAARSQFNTKSEFDNLLH